MQPRDRLTAKEIQVATLVWQGLTNKDIAGVLLTSEQVVKNYLRTAFDKLGVWTRLELALYVAGHGGANWHMQLGNGLLPPGSGWSVARGEQPQFSGSPEISSGISSGIGSGIGSTISSPVKEKPSASGGQL
jgi:DNA-binding CsgD family transcriptional regulator